MEKLITQITKEGENLNVDSLTQIAVCLNIVLSQFEGVFPEEDSPK